MSLRVRMGLAAGVAVALAVIAVAVSAYAGTRFFAQAHMRYACRWANASSCGL